jgi:predicted enzyme related to lactoylglutathione lyase
MARVLINIDVDDLDKAAGFYCDAFELTVSRRLGPEVVELSGAETAIYLLAKPAGSTAGTSCSGNLARDYRRHWTAVHLDFVVAELNVAIERAVHAGAALEGPVREYAWGRIAVLADPFGHGFCLLQFSERGYDAGL